VHVQNSLQMSASLGRSGQKQDHNARMELGSLLLSDTRKVAVDGLALWRQQVSAMAWVRFLKLKRSVKNL